MCIRDRTIGEPSHIFHSKYSAFADCPIIVIGTSLFPTFGATIRFTESIELTSNCFSSVDIFP